MASAARSSVGCRSGAKAGEWLPGAFSQSLKPPKPQYVYGTSSASGMMEKSSEAGIWSKSAASLPKWASNAPRTREVVSGSLSVSGYSS